MDIIALTAANKDLTAQVATLTDAASVASASAVKAAADLVASNTTIANLTKERDNGQDALATALKERDAEIALKEAALLEVGKLKGNAKSADELLLEKAAAAGVANGLPKTPGSTDKKDWMAAYNAETDPVKAAQIYDEHIKPALFGK